eukprot:scaffold2897_cov178-Amphora_coffeaeformis.AAC.1
MMMFKSTFKLCLSLLAVVGSSAQSLRSSDGVAHRSLQASGSILDIASGNENFSTLLTALQVAKLDGLLDCYWFCWFGHFTVFAPTNEAFGNLPNGILEKLVTPPYETHLTSLLAYHVLPQVVDSSAIANAGSVDAKTLQGDEITAALVGTGVVINDSADVIDPFDVEATNGIVHAIDKVLLPEFATKTIGDVATDAGLTALLDALTSTGLASPFTDATTTFTVFAPTNEAFEELTNSLGGSLDTETLANVLRYHVIPDDIVFSSEIRPGQSTPTLLQDEEIDFTRTSGWRYHIQLNENTNIVNANNLAINGVVHVIDKVLLPSSLRPASSEPDIVAMAQDTPIFSTLVEALVKADLVNTLQEPGPFTVFAPTNQAFNKALKDLELESLDDIPVDLLKNILLYHVVPNQEAFFRDLNDNSELPTALTDATIRVDLRYFLWWVIGARLNGSTRIVQSDIDVGNGVIHAIDEVLLPPTE